MRLLRPVIVASLRAACHRPTEVRGLYIEESGKGTLFPCDEPNTVVLVDDATLAAKYRVAATEPYQPLYVHLRGVKGHAGSIYGGPHYFLVHEVLEIRARRRGECPDIAPPVSRVLP